MRREKDAEQLAGCMAAALCWIMLPLAIAWSGYVLAYLWKWFVVTGFDAQELAWANASGIVLAVRWLASSSGYDPRDRDASWYMEKLILAVFGPLLTLGIGYAIYFWFVEALAT